MIKPAYSVSFLLSINIFVWQNVRYFLDAPRIYIDLFTLGNTAFTLLQQSLPPSSNLLSFLFPSPVDSCTGCVLLNLFHRLLMT